MEIACECRIRGAAIMVWLTLIPAAAQDNGRTSRRHERARPPPALIGSSWTAGPRSGMLSPGIPAPRARSKPVVTASNSSSLERRVPEPPPPRQERIPQAILFMVAAGMIFSFSSAASKWLVATYPVGEVLFSRVFVSLILFSAFALPTSGLAVLHTRRPSAHVLRSISQFTSQTLLLIAFSMMPLASATAINFSAPLFAALASLVFLKEPIGAARLAALVAGFFGVLIVTNPGGETFQIGALYALGNALLFGTVTAGVRGMTMTESAETLTMYQLIWLSLFYGLTLPFFFVTPTWADMPLIVANGVCNLLGQYW